MLCGVWCFVSAGTCGWGWSLLHLGHAFGVRDFLFEFAWFGFAHDHVDFWHGCVQAF